MPLVCRHLCLCQPFPARVLRMACPGPLPSTPASWQETGFGFVMFLLQTRPGGLRLDADSILTPSTAGRIQSCCGRDRAESSQLGHLRGSPSSEVRRQQDL